MAYRLALVGCAALALNGCAQNAATIDIAKGVSEKSASAMRDVSAYYDDIETRRRKAAAVVVASDTSCLPTLQLRVQTPARPRDKQGARCAAENAKGPNIHVLDFSRTPDNILKPRLALIAAVVDYGTALGKIAADPEADVSAELTSFVEKVDRVGTFLSFVTGDDAPTLDGVRQSAEGKAVESLLKFAVKLQHEAHQAKRIKELVGKEGDKVDQALATLAVQVDVWARGDLEVITRERRVALEQAYEKGRRRMSFTERQTTAEAIFDAQDEQRRLGDLSDRILVALEEVQTAQKELRDAVVGKFSEKRKRQIAKENLNRLTQALEIIGSVGRAFI
jgi:hypothetical protein